MSWNKGSITIIDVAPRDGFQAIPCFIETADKVAIVRGLVASHVPEIEIGSFVSPKALPQMRDTPEVIAAIQEAPHPPLRVLVPNLRGGELALAAGMNHLVYVISASEAHNRSNVRKSVAESCGEFRAVAAKLAPGSRFRFNLATAFDCPYEGLMAPERVLPLVAAVLEAVPQAEICLCDTTGKAVPSEVASLFARLGAIHGDRLWAYHAHDTYGLGLASSWAAFEAGVRVFDAAVGGLGGCPFAPGASGNVATEDLVFMFERSGIGTGIAMQPLLETARLAQGLVASGSGHIRMVAAQRASSGASQELARDALLDA